MSQTDYMKKLAIIIILIIISVSQAAPTCSEILFGDASVVAQYRGIDSQYQGYLYREGDSAFLRDLVLVNGGTCNISNITFNIWIEKPSGKIINLGMYQLPFLANQSGYSFSTNYSILKSRNIISPGDVLDEVGTYRIGHNATFNSNRNNSFNPGDPQGISQEVSLVFNGDVVSTPYFSVKSRTELDNLEVQKQLLFLTFASIIVALLLGLLGVAAQSYLQAREWKRQDRLKYLETLYLPLLNVTNKIINTFEILQHSPGWYLFKLTGDEDEIWKIRLKRLDKNLFDKITATEDKLSAFYGRISDPSEKDSQLILSELKKIYPGNIAIIRELKLKELKI
jgi:hypothetical protein